MRRVPRQIAPASMRPNPEVAVIEITQQTRRADIRGVFVHILEQVITARTRGEICRAALGGICNPLRKCIQVFAQDAHDNINEFLMPVIRAGSVVPRGDHREEVRITNSVASGIVQHFLGHCGVIGANDVAVRSTIHMVSCPHCIPVATCTDGRHVRITPRGLDP